MIFMNEIFDVNDELEFEYTIQMIDIDNELNVENEEINVNYTETKLNIVVKNLNIVFRKFEFEISRIQANDFNESFESFKSFTNAQRMFYSKNSANFDIKKKL